MFISQFFLLSFVLRKCQLRSYLSQQEGTVSVNTAPQLLCKQSTRGWGGFLEVGKERIYKRVSGLSSDVLVSDLWSHQIELDFWAAICVGTGWPNWPIDKLWRETSSSTRWFLFWIFANYKLGNQIKQWKHCSGIGFEPDIPKQPHPLM